MHCKWAFERLLVHESDGSFAAESFAAKCKEVPQLGALLSPFFGEGFPTEIDYRKKRVPLF